MANYGMFKNGEGYADPTAYKAIMGMAKAGEIWTYKNGECLIVKNQGTYCNILQLSDIEKHDCISVADKFANPGMISYAFNVKLGQYVDRLSPAQMGEVRGEIEAALGMNIVENMVACKAEPKEEPTVPNNERENALMAKLELLQGMYNDLLARVFAK